MKRIVFVMACAFAAICVVAAVYYSIPGVPHPFVVYGSGKVFLVNPAAQPLAARYTHHKYTAALLVLAALLGLVAYLSRKQKEAVKAA